MTERSEFFDVYIAGPLFNPEENFHNDTLTKMFRDVGYSVFNPHIDGLQFEDYKNLSEREAGRKLHDFDYNLVINSRIVVVNLNGQQIDDGTSSESAFAFANRLALTKIQERVTGFLEKNNLNEDKSNIYNQFLSNDEIFEPRVKLILGYFSDCRSITPFFKRNPVASENIDHIFNNREDIVKYALVHCPPNL
jgi:nucleoside 2-deoxyribosyltransferase